jgi:hypothetical protein
MHRQQLLRENPTEYRRIRALPPHEQEALYQATRHTLPMKWEYEPTPEQTEELIRICSRQSQRHARVGFNLGAPQPNEETDYE